MPELEIIQHPQIEGLHLFLNTVSHRTLHVHPEWELLWALDKPLNVICDKQAHRIAPGQIVLFSPNQPHSFCKTEAGDCTFLCIQMSPQRFPSSEALFADSIYPAEFLTGEEQLQLRRTLFSMLRTYLERSACYELKCLGQACLVLHSLLTRMPVHRVSAGETANRADRTARLMRLLDFVDKNYMHKIQLSTFAAMERRSMSYMSHFAKEMLNQSFQDYVNTVRFNCACKLIATGSSRMLDVCMESGFSDYRYFSQTFQKRVGMTPEAYSRLSQTPVQEEAKIHHSLHSLEQFYSRRRSLELLDIFEQRYLPLANTKRPCGHAAGAFHIHACPSFQHFAQNSRKQYSYNRNSFPPANLSNRLYQFVKEKAAGRAYTQKYRRRRSTCCISV